MGQYGRQQKDYNKPFTDATLIEYVRNELLHSLEEYKTVRIWPHQNRELRTFKKEQAAKLAETIRGSLRGQSPVGELFNQLATTHAAITEKRTAINKERKEKNGPGDLDKMLEKALNSLVPFVISRQDQFLAEQAALIKKFKQGERGSYHAVAHDMMTSDTRGEAAKTEDKANIFL